MTEVLQFVNVVAAAVMAGGQVFVLGVIVPVKRRWPERSSVELHQAMLHTLADRYLLPAGVVSGLSAIALFTLEFDAGTASTWLTLAGFGGLAGVAIMSERFNKPMNRMILGWSLDAIPVGYEGVRARWDRCHAIRTAFGVLALCCFVLAVVLF